MISEPLQAARDRKKTESLRNISRIFLHEGNQLVVASRAETIDGVVRDQYATRHLRIACYKCVQTFPHHRLHQLGHERDINDRLDGGRLDQGSCSMSDIDGYIAHALQVCVDLQSRDDKT